MNAAFADTSWWIAILDPYDALHEVADAVPHPALVVTSEAVLIELLNHFSGSRRTRVMAGTLARKLAADPRCKIVPWTTDLYRRSLDLYMSRPDKKWSLTDCSSMIVARDEGISDILSHDRHFEQAGFRALLREPSPSA